jgi:uncharacterized hydrophobic protein (TIGR00271 family)
MGLWSRIIDSDTRQRYALAEIREGLFVGEGNKTAKLTQFWVLLVLSSFIAAGGVIGNSTPSVIGAMIIAPLATPIYGVALATTIGNTRALRNSLLLLVSGIAVNILVGIFAAATSFNRMPLDQNPQITGRTAPTVLDLAVAVAVGLAGSFALARRDVSNIVAGVAIAISLVPVLAVVGITLGAGRFDLAGGAMLLFLTNAAAIVIAGVVVFGAARYYREAADAAPRIGRRARIMIAVVIVSLVIPLGVSSFRTFAYQLWLGHAQNAAEQWVAGTAWQVEYVTLENNEIIIGVVGPDSPPSRQELTRELRRTIPTSVPIRLVEVSGEESTF